MVRRLSTILLAAAGYAVSGQMSVLLAMPAGYASIIWPPAGVALVAILLLGYRAWPGVFLGSLLANLWRAIDAGGWNLPAEAVLIPALIGLGAAAQAVFGAWLVRRYVGSPGPLDTARDIGLFALFGGAVGCLVNAVWGPTVLLVVGNIPLDAYVQDIWIWWVGDVLGAVIVAPLLFTLWAEPRALWRSRRMSLGLPLIGLLILAMALFVLASARERDQLAGRFQQRAARISNDLTMHLQSRLDSMRAVVNVLHVYHEDDEGRFLHTTNQVLEPAPGVRALQWIPLISPGKHTGDAAPAAPGEDRFHYPLRLIGGAGAARAGIDMDLGIMPAGLAAIRRARDTGLPTLSAPLSLAMPDGTRRAMVALLPLYAEGEAPRDSIAWRRQSLRGFVAGLVLIDELIAEALVRVDLADFSLHIVDATDSTSERPLYVHESAAALSPGFRAEIDRLVGERLLRVTITPTMTALQRTRSWQAPVIWVAGLLVATLLGALLLLVTGHTARVEARVEAQAGALTEAHIALRQAEFLRRLAGSNVIGIVIVDAAGTVVEANDAFLSMLGYDREALARGQVRWDEITPPEWQDGDRAAFARIDEPGAAPAWEKEYLRRDGTRVPVMLGATRMEDENRYAAFVVDLTQVKQAEAALDRRTTELEQYKIIVNSTSTAIFAKEYSDQRQGVYILANPACNALFGKESVVGFTDQELLPADVAATLQAHDWQVLARGTADVMEESVPDARTGERKHYIVTKVPLRDAGGEPHGIAGITLDITEQKLLTDRLAALVDAIPDVMFRIRADGTYLDIKNNRDASLVVANEAVVGSNLRDMPLPEEIRRSSLEAIARAVETGEIQEIEYSLDLPSGRRYYETRIVKSGHGEVVVLMRDITETRHARAALEQTNARLRIANEELKEFAYVASHDLQEPLRTVRSFVELLERRYGDAFDERGRKWLELIVNGTQRMRSLIDDLLAYSRVGRTGEIGPVDTAHLVHEVLDDARASVDAADAVVQIGDLPVVTANAIELRQVFQNLISNALKFRRPDASPRVTIEAEHTPQGWAFAVTDNGIGIEAEYHERIFLVFQRLHPRDEYPGTGIGLALVKKIVERQGGTISVRSTAGESTTFRFTVPEGDGTIAADAPPDLAGM